MIGAGILQTSRVRIGKPGAIANQNRRRDRRRPCAPSADDVRESVARTQTRDRLPRPRQGRCPDARPPPASHSSRADQHDADGGRGRGDRPARRGRGSTGGSRREARGAGPAGPLATRSSRAGETAPPTSHPHSSSRGQRTVGAGSAATRSIRSTSTTSDALVPDHDASSRNAPSTITASSGARGFEPAQQRRMVCIP